MNFKFPLTAELSLTLQMTQGFSGDALKPLAPLPHPMKRNDFCATVRTWDPQAIPQQVFSRLWNAELMIRDSMRMGIGQPDIFGEMMYALMERARCCFSPDFFYRIQGWIQETLADGFSSPIVIEAKDLPEEAHYERAERLLFEGADLLWTAVEIDRLSDESASGDAFIIGLLELWNAEIPDEDHVED